MKRKLWRKGVTVALSAIMASSMIPSSTVIAMAGEEEIVEESTAAPQEEILTDETNESVNDYTEDNMEETPDLSVSAETEDVYVLMNIPYDKFYGAQDASVADVDTVSSATNKTGNYGKAGGAFHSATTASIAEDGTVTAVGGTNGSKVQGVIWPVKASDIEVIEKLGGTKVTDNEKVKSATMGQGRTSSTDLVGYETLTENKAYSYYVLSDKPSYYFELNNDGSFSVPDVTHELTGEADITVSYGTNWGDVQFAIKNIGDTDNKLINAVVFTTSEGKEVGFYHLDQIWAAGEIAWKVDATEGLDGKTITNIRYYCSVKDTDTTDAVAPDYANYIYDYTVNTAVSQVYTNEINASFEDDSIINVSGLPDDATNVKAKVYLAERAGKKITYTYLTPLTVDPSDDDIDPVSVDVIDGKIKIEKGSVTNNAGTTETYGEPIDGTLYTVELSSDNYIFRKTSADKHIWNDGEITKEASCTEAGMKTYTCTVCGETKTEEIAATGKHSWNDGVVTKEPTYTEDGVKTYTCNKCGETKTETVPKLTPKHTFTDVPNSGNTAQFYNEITWMADEGYSTGWKDGTFRPWNTINRAAVVTFLWRMNGSQEPKEMATFSDMTGNADFDKAISWAAERGITTGYSDNTFRPWEPCNRAAIVTFIWRAEDKPTGFTSKFSDKTGNSDFDTAIAWASANGITNGFSDGTFKPWDTCKRAAVAAFLYRTK